MRYTNTGIAAICHEAIRGLQIAQNCNYPSDPWLSAPPWQREMTIEGVVRARNVITPRDHHEAWREAMSLDGWSYGPRRDWELKHHPNMVPYDQLPPGERDKDELFLLITTWAVGKG